MCCCCRFALISSLSSFFLFLPFLSPVLSSPFFVPHGMPRTGTVQIAAADWDCTRLFRPSFKLQLAFSNNRYLGYTISSILLENIQVQTLICLSTNESRLCASVIQQSVDIRQQNYSSTSLITLFIHILLHIHKIYQDHTFNFLCLYIL